MKSITTTSILLFLASVTPAILATPTDNFPSITIAHPLRTRETLVGVPSTMDITAFNDDRCEKSSNNWPAFKYNTNETWTGFRGYKVSRLLLPGEQLDFSTSVESSQSGPEGDGQDGGDACAMFISTPSPNSLVVGKCMTLSKSAQCVNLWHH